MGLKSKGQVVLVLLMGKEALVLGGQQYNCQSTMATTYWLLLGVLV